MQENILKRFEEVLPNPHGTEKQKVLYSITQLKTPFPDVGLNVFFAVMFDKVFGDLFDENGQLRPGSLQIMEGKCRETTLTHYKDFIEEISTQITENLEEKWNGNA